MKYYISQAPANPLVRIVAAIIATISLVAAFFFGLVILAVIAGAVALFSLAFWFRALWIGRKTPQPKVQRQNRPGSGEIIEAEYTVISERHTRDD